MIIKPMIRNNICMNSHPAGCFKAVQRQIEYAEKNLTPVRGITPSLALIIGCSAGYGLASRVAAAFGYRAATVGISLEKPGTEKHPATAGHYNNLAFDREAAKQGLVSVSLNTDAFSDEARAAAVRAVRDAAEKAKIKAKIDLVVYSLASPVRKDPKTGILYKSAIKPIGEPFSDRSLDMMDGSIFIVRAEPATEEEISGTVKVMGGEDWKFWMETLDQENLLTEETRTLAYTYIGPECSWPIYRNGTIGRAKADLEQTAAELNKRYIAAGKIAGAWVSVNKALVTRSSAVIPVIPLYVSCLFRVMKDMGLHEDCIAQIARLYRERLYICKNGGHEVVPVDDNNRIRMDDWEMREDVQKSTAEKMAAVNAENVYALTDIAGFRRDFYEVHGFGIDGVDYEADTDLTGYSGL